jgi:hypothetical protein
MMRHPWMSRIPHMKNRRCSTCGKEFAQWLGLVPLRHEVARGLAHLWLLFWLAAAAIGFGLGVAWLVEWQYGRY